MCVTTYHSLCVVNLPLVAQSGLSRNWLIEPIEQHLFRENSIDLHGDASRDAPNQSQTHSQAATQVAKLQSCRLVS